MKNKFNLFTRIVLGSLLFAVVFMATLYGVVKYQKYLEQKTIETEKKSTLIEAKKNIVKPEDSEKVDIANLIEKELPKASYLEVPFICQAPLETVENWKYHEESCEEAALLQAYLYETGTTMTKQEANTKILEMIEWQNKNMGGHHDLYANDMQKFASEFYNLKENEIKIIKDASIEQIKREISNGHPVIVPITGDILKNPYYPYPGYHMLIVIGYTEDKIITNDNGTRRGKDFSYDTKVFEAAMKDAGGDVMILKINRD